jgi:hypothetical protein
MRDQLSHFARLRAGGLCTFAVKGTPTTFFIDRQQRVVVCTRISDPGDPPLEKVIQQILK